MPPWQQAKVFGLKEAWEEMHGDKTYGQLKWIAERVYVQGHPKRHPSHEAVRQLLEKMATDEDWFPGKLYGCWVDDLLKFQRRARQPWPGAPWP